MVSRIDGFGESNSLHPRICEWHRPSHLLHPWFRSHVEMPRSRVVSPDAVRFGAIVERLRVARGWTRKKLLQRAGLTPQYVAIVEQGGNVPSLTTVLELIEVLRGDVAEVMREAYLGRQFLDAIKRADEKNEIALAQRVEQAPQRMHSLHGKPAPAI